MKKFRLLLLFAFVSILFFNACEKEDQLVNESYTENYTGQDKNKDNHEHKVKICKNNGNGSWRLIEIAESALTAHLNKGAVYPDACFDINRKMDENCVVLDLSKVEEICGNKMDDDCDPSTPDICPILKVSSKGIFGRGAWYSNFCDIYVEDGLTDWRIPTYDEIKQLDEEERLYEIKFRPYRYWIRNLDYYTFTLKDNNFYLRSSDNDWYRDAEPQLPRRANACFCVHD